MDGYIFVKMIEQINCASDSIRHRPIPCKPFVDNEITRVSQIPIRLSARHFFPSKEPYEQVKHSEHDNDCT